MGKRRSEEIEEAVEEALATIAESPHADDLEFLTGLVEGIKLQIRSLTKEGAGDDWDGEEGLGEDDDG